MQSANPLSFDSNLDRQGVFENCQCLRRALWAVYCCWGNTERVKQPGAANPLYRIMGLFLLCLIAGSVLLLPHPKQESGEATQLNLIVYGIVTLVILFISVGVTSTCFPFWTIYSPQTGISWLVNMIFCAPVMVINMIILVDYSQAFRMHTRKPRHAVLTLMLLWVSLAFPVIGAWHNEYISNPMTNAQLYRQPREQVVRLVETRQIRGSRDCLAHPQPIYSKENPCVETIALPQKYRNLSRSRAIELRYDSQQISVAFTLYTYGFGDGSVGVAYVKSTPGDPSGHWQRWSWH